MKVSIYFYCCKQMRFGVRVHVCTGKWKLVNGKWRKENESECGNVEMWKIGNVHIVRFRLALESISKRHKNVYVVMRVIVAIVSLTTRLHSVIVFVSLRVVPWEWLRLVTI